MRSGSMVYGLRVTRYGLRVTGYKKGLFPIFTTRNTQLVTSSFKVKNNVLSDINNKLQISLH
jgi:hypothetical protein